MKSPLHETGTANSMMNIPIFESKELAAAWQSGYAAGLAAGEAARRELVEVLAEARNQIEYLRQKFSATETEAAILAHLAALLQKHEKGSGG